MTQDLKVMNVIGLSNCGSTLFNLILDTHSEIYGGGELLYALPEDGRQEVSCTNCGSDCEFWKEENISKIREVDFYKTVSEIFDSKVILDSSKQISWASRIKKSNPEQSFTYILILKHPLRHLTSSFTKLSNPNTSKQKLPLIPRAKNFISRNINDLKLKTSDPRKRNLLKCLNTLSYGYSKIDQDLISLSQNSSLFVITYESLVLEPEKTLSPLLASVGLEYDSRMLRNCFQTPHHQIAGNDGALFQTKKQWRPESVSSDDATRKKYYENLSGIRIDDKYKKILSAEEIAWIKKQKKYQQLCDKLGYSIDPYEN